LKYIIKFCPQCGQDSLKFDGKNQYHCPECSFTFYRNVAAAAAAVIYYQGKILFIERGKEPQKGLLGLPGGFIDNNETAESGLLREVYEEVGIKLDTLEYFCNQTNEYHYCGVTYHTLDFYYIARIDKLPDNVDPEEVAGIKLITLKDLDFDQIAFTSAKEALGKLIKCEDKFLAKAAEV